MSLRTRQSCCGAVAAIAKYYRRAPNQLSAEEIQSYLLYLIEERKLAHSSCLVALHGLRFFYHETLKRRDYRFGVPRSRMQQKLPEILSREEIEQLFAAVTNPKHRALLMTTYAAGLRVSEVCALKVTDIDSHRMVIRVEQGKGAKDRYSLLSPRLLKELRHYWQIDGPAEWLFPSPTRSDQPLSTQAALRMYHAARAAARITKRGGIHSLRHAFATHLLENGTDVHTIQRLMGHGDIHTTLRYCHLAQQHITATRSPLELLKT